MPFTLPLTHPFMGKKPHFIFQFTNRCGKIWFRHSFIKKKTTHLPVYTSAAKECSTEGPRKGSLDSCRGTSLIVIHPSPCHTCRWTSSEAFGSLDYATITQMQRERERDVISLTPVSWQSSAIFCCGRMSTIECCTWRKRTYVKNYTLQRRSEKARKSLTWLLTTGIPFSRIFWSLTVSKLVKATVFILPTQQMLK